jgi:predicted ATPase
MRIQSIEVKNFKSLVDFKLDLGKFNCLIGLNGSGKSTVLQFIDFLSQLVQGDMKAWLKERKWVANDLKSKLTKKVNVEFCIRFSDDLGNPSGQWDATYSPKENRCTKEEIVFADSSLKTKRGGVGGDVVGVTDRTKPETLAYPIAFEYEGSILSGLKEEYLLPTLLECKSLCQEIKSLDLLDPEHLRQKTREFPGDLGLGGQYLAAFLHEMGHQKRQELLSSLKSVYPQLQDLHAKALRSGSKQIEISEGYSGADSGLLPTMTTEARHINDGMLRLMAIFAELQTKHRFVLFDEIENGINPEAVEFVINMLVNAVQQVLVTTHSPMILNYLDDEMAKNGVIYLYKTSQGHTKSIPFFSIPSLAKKLTVMGPGEAFVDTNLTQLAEEIAGLNGEEA